MEGIDLRKYQQDGEEKDKIKNILGKIISGRDGYETVIDETRKIKRCPSPDCNWALEGGEKFCPECGTKC